MLATTLTVAFVLAPVSVAAQPNNGGEKENEKKQENSEAADSGTSEAQGPTPEVYLFPPLSAGEGISDIVPQRIGELLRERVSGDRPERKRLRLRPIRRARTDL